MGSQGRASCSSLRTPPPLSALRALRCGTSGLAELVRCMHVCSSVQSLKTEFFSFLLASWQQTVLNDTDSGKNFGLDLHVLFKRHEIWSVNSQENY